MTQYLIMQTTTHVNLQNNIVGGIPPDDVLQSICADGRISDFPNIVKKILSENSGNQENFNYRFLHPKSLLEELHSVTWEDLQTVKIGERIDYKVVNHYLRVIIHDTISEGKLCPPIYTTFESQHNQSKHLAEKNEWYDRDDVKIVVMHNYPLGFTKKDISKRKEFDEKEKGIHYIFVLIFPPPPTKKQRRYMVFDPSLRGKFGKQIDPDFKNILLKSGFITKYDTMKHMDFKSEKWPV